MTRIRTIDCRSAEAGRELVSSLRETGFAVLRRHPIPHALLQRLHDDWIGFFHSDHRTDFLFDSTSTQSTRGGYYPLDVSETAVTHTTRDIKEFFHVVPGQELPPECEQAILEFRDLGFAFGNTLLEWLQEYTPDSITAALPEPFPGMLCIHASLLRILHYPPLRGSEDDEAVRAAAHEDINLITILPVSEQPGLQVKDSNGVWIDVSGNRGDIVINSGDMLREATAGYFPSATHRVINPRGGDENISRISVPLFLTPRLEVRLSDRYTSGSYLDERLKLIRRDESVSR